MARGSVKTFLHSGKLGDIVYALPAIRALGGGTLLLRPDERIVFSPAAAESITPLLEKLDYIHSVRIWQGEQADYNLDRFRTISSPFLSVVQSYFTAFELPEDSADEAWLPSGLSVSKPSYDVLFSRSLGRHEGVDAGVLRRRTPARGNGAGKHRLLRMAIPLQWKLGWRPMARRQVGWFKAATSRRSQNAHSKCAVQMRDTSLFFEFISQP